ncbi:MAG: hypothetical protein ABSE68_02930 [Minisyncoccia bacterium]
MKEKQIAIVVAFALVVLGGGVIGFIFRNGGGNGNIVGNNPSNGSVSTSSGNGQNPDYSSDIPKGAALSVPINSAPANSNPGSAAEIKFFDLRATRNGFSVPMLVVSQRDSLSVNFTAVDGDYDLDIPYLGAYFSVVKKGETKKLPIDTSTAGTFIMECRDYCPSSGQIKSSLVVLPRK